MVESVGCDLVGKAPVTLSRNEREPAGITIFKIRDTFGRDSHRFFKIRNAVRIL